MISNVITAEMCNGVFEELLAVLPVILPVTVGFIGIRKAISFVLGMLHSA